MNQLKYVGLVTVVQTDVFVPKVVLVEEVGVQLVPHPLPVVAANLRNTQGGGTYCGNVCNFMDPENCPSSVLLLMVETLTVMVDLVVTIQRMPTKL